MPSGISRSPVEHREDTEAKYAFVYGDFGREHRSGLLACQYRAGEWRHGEVERATHEQLQHLEETSA
jgi:hypothetical protein